MPRLLSSLPSPKGLPVFGHVHKLMADPLACFSEAAKLGPMVRLRLGPRDMIVLTDPDGIEQILVKHRREMHKDRITASLSAVLGEGLVTSEGEVWTRHRKLVAPVFQPHQVATFAQTMVETGVRVAAATPTGPQDVYEVFGPLALEIVTKTVFGAQFPDTGRVLSLVNEMMTAFDLQIHSWRRLLPEGVPTDASRRLKAARRAFDQVVDRMIVLHRTSGEEDDLLGRLLAARDDDGQGMSDAALRDEAITLLVAGYESSALSMSFTLFLLARHPELQERAYAEIMATIGDRDPTPADLKAMPFVDALLRESNRLYPPAWAIGRSAIEDVVVTDVDVPAGTQMLAPQWVVHRDPRWFPDALVFRPDRWLNGETESLPRFAFYPFGGGPRVCVGAHFARLEALLLLAIWIRAFECRPVPGFEMKLRPSATLRSQNGIRVDLRRR